MLRNRTARSGRPGLRNQCATRRRRRVHETRLSLKRWRRERKLRPRWHLKWTRLIVRQPRQWQRLCKPCAECAQVCALPHCQFVSEGDDCAGVCETSRRFHMKPSALRCNGWWLLVTLELEICTCTVHQGSVHVLGTYSTHPLWCTCPLSR